MAEEDDDRVFVSGPAPGLDPSDEGDDRVFVADAAPDAVGMRGWVGIGRPREPEKAWCVWSFSRHRSLCTWSGRACCPRGVFLARPWGAAPFHRMRRCRVDLHAGICGGTWC
jgi:hypothetical protein